MKVYAVGGCVRDKLLGVPVTDRDWVVVGATPQEMIAAGFRPVGRDFPVFLHPRTHEEYALARTERKTAPGYKGFVFHAGGGVTLEEDLARRVLCLRRFCCPASIRKRGIPKPPSRPTLILNRSIHGGLFYRPSEVIGCLTACHILH